MNTNTFNFISEEYLQAAPDTQLSSSHSHLLLTLLTEEDQHDYNQLLTTSLSHDIFDILHQLASFLHLASSTTWTTIILLKKLVLLHYDIDLLTIIASLTLSAKYQHSQTHHIDYQLLAHHCHIPTIDLIHDAEMVILDALDYDVCVGTPDHFFSYLSNVTTVDDQVTLRQMIDQARSALSHHTLELLSSYPSSIVSLSVLLMASPVSSYDMMSELIKSFVVHKKDQSHYLTQLKHCTVQLQSVISSCL